ncbi:MAG: hypothetical protein J7L71_10485 [Spirochaetaceae bacterium]|nr:hypothetical protein [Spirochaetaceae bacterium]
MKYFIITICLYLSILTVPFAETLKSIFPDLGEQQLSELNSNGEITRYFFDNETPDFLFDTTFSDQILSDIKKLNLNIGVESVYFLKTDQNVPLLDIYNTLLSISTMKGIDYYSQTRKKYKTLYTGSHVIVGKTDTRELPDPVINTLENFKQIFIEQTDTTFGKNIYKTTYRTDGNLIWLEMTNETPMKYSFIRMVDKENISINLLIKKTDTGIIFYGITSAKTFSFLGIEKKNKESFYNRMKALYNWFINSIN